MIVLNMGKKYKTTSILVNDVDVFVGFQYKDTSGRKTRNLK